ncbi:MAG: hypothetical protein SAJ12_17035 [Jaaginema sp. PMC 1079.18]|nr:hypothetical protein [Jaaginema sp. PMC 1080.18]MEC4852687.1 hypothetical protein [Jaaginema sp. PMC 1079.18]MEC4868739.1 hypothetical protein [Jaaginema sp. PMC 1078.18]
MFLDELTPIAQELLQQPVAFMGGFFSGVFRLNVAEEPLKSWLEQQGATVTATPYESNGNSKGPQSIAID